MSGVADTDSLLWDCLSCVDRVVVFVVEVAICELCDGAMNPRQV